MKITSIKHRPTTWEKLYDLKVYDPDGWRRDGQSFYKPIDEVEWNSRMCESTCCFSKKAFEIMKGKKI